MFRMPLPDIGGPLRWMTGLVTTVLRPAVAPATVLVVADQAVFADALALAIDAAAATSCAAVAHGSEQALRMAATVGPDIAVLDLDGEQDHDFSTMRALLEARPALRILLLTEQTPSPGLVRAAVSAGAAAVFPKTTSLSVVVSALPTLTDQLFTTDRRTIAALCEVEPMPIRGKTPTASIRTESPQRPPNPLTRRERDILALLDSGVDLPSASEKLGISVNTTRGYVKNLYRKLDVHSQVELLAVARDKGLLDEG